MNNWTLYILRCNDQTLYTGITTDIQRRLTEHNQDNRKGARYTRARRPVTLIHQEQFADRASASKREARIKKMKRKEKEELIKNHLQNFHPEGDF